MNKLPISDNLYLYEYECPCCNMVKLDEELVKKNQQMRNILNGENKDNAVFYILIIDSGYRCMKHHIKLYRNKYGEEWRKYIAWGSFHLKGQAADIKSIAKRKSDNKVVGDFVDGHILHKIAVEVGFKGIGIGSNWCHVDLRESAWIHHYDY